MLLALPASAGAFLTVALLLPVPCRAQEGTWALTNARIETVAKGVIEHGTIVVRDGLIQAVGADVTPPADAAARIFGVADRLGSVEPGKEATLIVTDGDPLDARVGPKYVFTRGELVPFNDRHTRLYEEFRARPAP